MAARKKRGKGCLIALLVVLALIVVIVVIVVAANGGSDTASKPGTTASNTKSGSGGGSGSKTASGINTPVKDGKFQFTVTKVKCGVKSVGSDMLGSKAQGQFCLYTVTVKNIGNEAQTFDSTPQKGLSSSGVEYSSDTEAAIYANENNKSFLNEINPGNQVVGAVIVFDIPKDAKIATLELHDSMFSGGVNVKVS